MRKKLYRRFREIGYTSTMALFLTDELTKASESFNGLVSPAIISTKINGKIKNDVSWRKPLEILSQ